MTAPTLHAPTTDADLLGIRLAHRSMTTDVRRLTDTTEAIGWGRQACSPRRATAIGNYVELLIESIDHHHHTEDDVLWPVLEAAAGAHVDLDALSDDHTELAELLTELQHTSSTFARSATAEDAMTLAHTLARLGALLDEHLEDEERTIFPIITRYVDKSDWTAVEESARKRGRLDFDGPRALGAAEPAELERIMAEGGIMLRILAPVLTRKHRKRERAVFA